MNKKKVIIIISIILLIIFIIIISLLLSKNNKTYAIGDTLADTVIAQSKGSSWNAGDSGVYFTNNHEYRYVGANVNNYVSFNDDLYRIIGVFDSNTHGQEGKMLVKLIRSEILGGYSWGNYNSSNTSGTYSNYSNDWTGETTGIKANLNVLLNEYFYNKTNISSTYGNCSDWTYYYNNNDYRTNDCSNIVGYGMERSLKNYIEEVTWYLYGTTKYYTKINMYLCERGQFSGCTSANNGVYSTSTNAKIGLMYVSDYLYASGYYNNSSTDLGNSYYFGNQNWLYKGAEWLINPISNSQTKSLYVVPYGNVNSSNAYNGYGARPTFYLKSSVYVTGGSGTFDNPYTISCDDCN